MSDPTVTGTPEPESDGPFATVAAEARAASDDTPVAPPGYDLHTLIGSGGMGAVYRAHDLSLTRDVAVKFLHARFAPESVAAWRFTEEARITARLQHPGIPPVHQVGRTPDGRPYLAMKLIKGETLESLLNARQSPAEDRGRFVGIFEQVAQAVAFAHSRRIIHRDLKPANVMVGGFGEVQVMDWGLAKELGTGASAEAGRTDATLSVELGSGREGAETTQAGSLLGTPAFMPPEQAVGAIDLIDERADVFGLGAILCVVLTGQPPFIATTAEAARVLAARGKLDDAFTRLNACGAEPELVALAKRCLSPEAADRPANAGEVARAVAAFRADAERRARQAEMDRATAEVKAAEERKRRRVQRVLALALFALLLVIGYTVRRIENEQTKARLDEEARLRQRAEEANARVADLKARQLVTERDVTAALKEVQVLREQGLTQIDDPDRWALTLTAAHSAQKRAEGVLASGEPTDDLQLRVARARSELAQDDRDRALLAELDRVADDNEIRLFIPVSFTKVTSRRFAAAFRMHALDLMAVPTEDAVAWLKGHRFRTRLVIAIRNWHQSYPAWDVASDIDTSLVESLTALAAVGGNVSVAALAKDPNRVLEKLLRATGPRARLSAILKALPGDPFTREWWTAVAKRDLAALRTLIARPEMLRLSSRELSSLADGLAPESGNSAVLHEFLDLALDRFPGEFWVHFRLATLDAMSGSKKSKVKPDDTLRHLSAAVAARPNSAIARVVLGMELMEKRKDDPSGPRLIRSAAEVDPNSPWPHLFIGMMAAEKGDWAEMSRALQQCVRSDPDTGFFMIYSTTMFLFTERPGGPKAPPEQQIGQLLDTLIATQPKHSGGYHLRATHLEKTGDPRAALTSFRTAQSMASPDYFGKVLIEPEIKRLESMASWETKLPAVLKGEIRPTDSTELAELAEYCAKFEKKYALATRFVAEALAADPQVYGLLKVPEFAGWAVLAAAGKGTDAADLAPDERTRLRRLALGWLRENRSRMRKELLELLAHEVRVNPGLALVREPNELAKLPPDERAEWEAYWAALGPKRPAVAPPPREVKR